jgi:hypothetical protein
VRAYKTIGQRQLTLHIFHPEGFLPPKPTPDAELGWLSI